jgi:hypothetical protein
MPVHWESGTVFFHIPKCGGTSFEIMFSMMDKKSLWSEDWGEFNFRGVNFAPQHLTPDALFKFYPETRDFRSLCITRHPVKKAVSEYIFLATNHPSVPKAIRKRFKYTELGFRLWLKSVAKKKKFDHTLDQWEWAKSSDFLYDLADFDSAASKFSELTGINPLHEKINANKSPYNTAEIVDGLSYKSIKLIREIYSSDFKNIGYS